MACLAAIAMPAIAAGGGAALIGAWPVLPFAGLEVMLVALAFHALARHDGDYERLELAGARLRLQTQCAARVQAFECNLPWARLVVKESRGRCGLGLRYAGKTVEFGRLLTDDGRREWAAQLGRRLPVSRI